MTMLEIGPKTLNQMSLAKENNKQILRDKLKLNGEEQDHLIFFDWKRMNVQFGKARFCDLALLKEFYDEKEPVRAFVEGNEEEIKTVDKYLERIEREKKESKYCDFFLEKFDETSTLPSQMLRRYGEQKNLLKSPVHYLTELISILSEGSMVVVPGDYQYVVTKEKDGTIAVEMRNEIAECYSINPETSQKILYQEETHSSGKPIGIVSSKMHISANGAVVYDELQIDFLDSRFMEICEEKLRKSQSLSDEQEEELDDNQKRDLKHFYEAAYNIVDNYLDVFAQMDLPADVKNKIAEFKSKYSDPDKYNFILYAYSVLKKEQADREANGRFDAALKIVTDLAEYLGCEIQKVDAQSFVRFMNISDVGPYALLIKRTKPVYRLVYQEEAKGKSIEFKEALYDTLSEMAEELDDGIKEAIFDPKLSTPEFIEQIIEADRKEFLNNSEIVAYCHSKGFTLFQDQSGNVRLYPKSFSERTLKGYVYLQDKKGVHRNEITMEGFIKDTNKKREL